MHRDVVHVKAIDHRVDKLVQCAPEIRSPGIKPAHAALRLREDEAAAGEGDADVIDGEPRLAPDGVDADCRIQPESRRGVTDGVRRPPREHLGLEREAARGAGSSCRRVRRLTGCRVRHVVDRGFHLVSHARAATRARRSRRDRCGVLHHMAAPLPGPRAAPRLRYLPPTLRGCCRTGRCEPPCGRGDGGAHVAQRRSNALPVTDATVARFVAKCASPPCPAARSAQPARDTLLLAEAPAMNILICRSWCVPGT